MIYLENIKSSGFFKEISLEKWDILLKEWDIDSNLYIIYDGELCVEKSITSKKWEFKHLWLLWIGNIVWEAALSHNEPKQVQIKANRNTLLLSIDGKDEFPKYVTKFPRDGYNILINIIDITNSRLLKSNRELTANYEVNIIELSRYIRFANLSLWEESYWFLVVGRERKDFHENEEQLLVNTAWSFVWIIHQKSLIDEAKNKSYIKSAL